MGFKCWDAKALLLTADLPIKLGAEQLVALRRCEAVATCPRKRRAAR